jgi:hypothetical protein
VDADTAVIRRKIGQRTRGTAPNLNGSFKGSASLDEKSSPPNAANVALRDASRIDERWKEPPTWPEPESRISVADEILFVSNIWKWTAAKRQAHR